MVWGQENPVFRCVKRQSNIENKKWKFYFVITKMITRFARNTLDEDSELRHTMVMKTLNEKSKGRETGP